jgi:hypothetical protein
MRAYRPHRTYSVFVFPTDDADLAAASGYQVKSAAFEIVERADVMPQGSVAQPLFNDAVVR